MARDLQDLAVEMGQRGGAAALQAHIAHRRRWRMTPGVQGTVTARLDGERWLADCPFCAGAELVARSVGFFCMSCGMVANGGHPCAVTFPGGE
jgi:hypothetical protein